MFNTIISNFHLEKILWIIKTKMKYIILYLLISALAFGAYASFTQKSTYVASISFYVYSNPDYVQDTNVNLSSTEISQAKTLLDSYMLILKSSTFLNSVKEKTGLNQYSISALKSRISAAAVSNTAVFTVSVYDANPVNAMNIANAIGDLAPDQIIRVVKSGGIEVLDAAELPTVPYASTNVIKYVAIGAAIGFLLSLLYFLIKGLMDTTVRRMYEIEDMFTIPILGTVPIIDYGKKDKKKDAKKDAKKSNVILEDSSSFMVKESYSNIRANLLFTGKGEKCPVYAITSADTGEGKTLNAINLAISYAQLGKKVLLVDSDMRKSSMSSILNISSKEGLSQYLGGVTDKVEVIRKQENLDVILAGYQPPNPAELLESKRWIDLLNQYKQEYDVVFIDLPPLGIVSDALSMVQYATAYILVIREKLSKFERERMIVQKLEPLEANICGFIYNGISVKSPDYNYKKYGKEYSSSGNSNSEKTEGVLQQG